MNLKPTQIKKAHAAMYIALDIKNTPIRFHIAIIASKSSIELSFIF